MTETAATSPAAAPGPAGRTADLLRLWFPLVARPRPACPALHARVTEITQLVEAARTRQGVEGLRDAAVAQNKAALIASDCGLTTLARAWCRAQLNTYLRAIPLTAELAQHALEPVVNLARLLIREGEGDAAYGLLEDLFKAARDRRGLSVGGQVVPFDVLTVSADDHRALCRWLWTVLLGDGTRALTCSGAWERAREQLETHRGIGRRLLDGRQVAVLVHHTAGEAERALQVLQDAVPTEPWERAVAGCLRVVCEGPQRRSGHLDEAVRCYDEAVDRSPGLLVFWVRLGLTMIEAGGGPTEAAVAELARNLQERVLDATNGYAARDLLANVATRSWPNLDVDRLTRTVTKAGLGCGSMPPADLARLRASVKTAGTVVRERLALRPSCV